MTGKGKESEGKSVLLQFFCVGLQESDFKIFLQLSRRKSFPQNSSCKNHRISRVSIKKHKFKKGLFECAVIRYQLI